MPFVADEFTGKRFGKYEVLCRLAVGGMAEIFLGFPLAGPFAFKPVVLKRILSDHREDPSSLQMLIDEAKLTAQLHHKHVAQVLDLEVAEEDVILVIELIQGANLEELVEATGQRKELLPLGFILAAIRDAAAGLQHAHVHKDNAGTPMPIIHRDVTPRNLMVTFAGVGKVLDFGIARAVGASRRTVAGMVRGTAAYMSPEQAIDAKVDTRSDIFSLGVIFHELLVGQRLFARGHPGKEMAAVYEAEIPVPSIANKRVPKAFDAVVLRALERSVSRRYQSPAELIRDLQAAAGNGIWPIDRCGELVRGLFATRKQELDSLLERIPDEGPAATTDVGREAIDDDVDSEVRTLVGVPGGIAPTVEVPTNPGEVLSREKSVPTQPARKPRGREADSQAPTKFFTPDFGSATAPKRGESTTDEGPVPTALSGSPLAMVTQPGVAPSPAPSPERSRRHLPSLPHDTATQRATPRGARTALLIVGAVGAMVLGAAGGVLVYRSMAPAKVVTPEGVGRISIATDRPADVRIGNATYQAPVSDVYVEIGHQVLEVRERNSDGPWKRVEFDVTADKVTKLQIRLAAPP